MSSPQVVKFCNERIRPCADTIARVAVQVSAIVQEWQAKGLVDQIPDDATVIDDGAATDGRTPITGHDVRQMIALAEDLVAMATGQNTRMPTVIKVAVNPGS
jgi:hypothetical protein